MSKPFQWLLIAFIFPLILLISIGIFSHFSNFQLNTAFRRLNHTEDVLLQSQKILSSLYDVESVLRGYIYVKDSSFLVSYYEGRKKMIGQIRVLDSLVTPTAPQQKAIIDLNRLIFSNIAVQDTVMKMSRSNDPDQQEQISVFMEISRSRLDKVANIIDSIIDEENAVHNTLIVKRELYAARTNWAQWLVIILGIIFFSVAFWRMSVEWRKRIAYERQLKLKVRALEEQNVQLEAFSFVLSHQLQEPLRKLGLFSDKLQRFQSELLPEEASYLMQRIGLFSGKISQLLEGIRAITELHKQDRSLWSRFSLENLIKRVENSFSDLLQEKQAVVLIESILPDIMGDYRQLELMFRHLFENSLTFVRDDVAPQIKLSAAELEKESLHKHIPLIADQKYIRILFADNGIGFSSDFNEKVFEIFQKLGQNDKLDGSGLGLALCKKVVMNHDGYILAKGTPNNGTIIEIFLPKL